ncbi:MAG: hypothetical protein CW338_09640, partial [Clostridiales bacterium]|nr:hypothetical protein [Clostridiales bacterium]
YTKRALNELRRYGGNATFFVVGERCSKNHYNLCRQHNGLYSIQSHNYYHEIGGSYSVSDMFKWKERMDTELKALLGVGPTIIRAPGGRENALVRAGYGMPLIHWSIISNDISSSGKANVDKVSANVLRRVKDGDVVLMHDLCINCNEYTRVIMETLNEQGWLCVTVEELFHDAGIELVPDQVYYSTTWDYSKK